MTLHITNGDCAVTALQNANIAGDFLVAEQYALAQRAWAAFRAPDPRVVTALIAGDTTALPHLHPALLRWLEEFPAVGSGLSRTQQLRNSRYLNA